MKSLTINSEKIAIYTISRVIEMFERIRNLREDKDLTQTQLANHLHCSQRIYSNYERGEVDIPTNILTKLADFHDTSIDYLLNRTDNPSPYERK